MKNIDIDMVILENIDIEINIDMDFLENIDINKGILKNIDIDKISYRLEFGISNRATILPGQTLCVLKTVWHQSYQESKYLICLAFLIPFVTQPNATEFLV